METIKIPLQSNQFAWLCVAHCQGYCSYGREDLKCDDLDYVIKFLPVDTAQTFFNALGAQITNKTHHIQQMMLTDQGNSNYEIPFLTGHDLQSLHVVNNAHVIPALIALGAERIPFRVHKHFVAQL